jgi:uncharacterized protein with PIN domain
VAFMDEIRKARGPRASDDYRHLPFMEQLRKIKEAAAAEAAEAPLDHWQLQLERLRGEIGADGVERITTQAIFDILEVLQRNRDAGASRRLAKLMTELGWTAVRVRARTRGDYREQVRGYCRDARHKTLPPSCLTERPRPTFTPRNPETPSGNPITPLRQMLKTLVRRIEYDFTDFTGRLHMDDGCCCDMSDCIAFFKTIDPNVTYTSTLAGARQDTCYRLIDGEWRAFLWRNGHFIPAPPSRNTRSRDGSMVSEAGAVGQRVRPLTAVLPRPTISPSDH